MSRIAISIAALVTFCVRLASAQVATNKTAANPFQVVDSSGHVLPLFSIDAYRAEFRYLSNEFRKINLLGPPVVTDGWTTNIAEAEWPVMSCAYLGLACANLAECDPDPAMHGDYLAEMRWLLDALQTPRLSGFMKPHFGEPFSGNEIHAAVFLHGHFLNLATRYREVSGDTNYDALIHRVASALTNSYATTDQGILRSYRDMWWITDNFPALSALARYNRLFRSYTRTFDAHTKFLQNLKQYYLDKQTGMYCTYVNPDTHSQSQGPRGISVMYGLHFLRDFDPPFALEQYNLAKKFLIRDVLGVCAAREFPEGENAKGDIDSGPVIFGLGLSASGFGIAAAVINGDTNTAQRLLNASAMAGLPVLRDGNLHYTSMPTVGQAVVLFGKTELLKRSSETFTKRTLDKLCADLAASRMTPLIHNTNGQVKSLTLSWNQTSAENIDCVSQITSIRDLSLQVRSRDFTRPVAESVSHMTNLLDLRLACGFRLQPDVINEISKLKGLRCLKLYYSQPTTGEYASLTNLHNLESIQLVNCTNFTDVELRLLTNFPKLTNLEIKYCGITPAGTNMLSCLTNLTQLGVFWR